ncbi:MAG: hypothetical protein HGA29_01290 [Syntrophaceae bacterium]|nr:hypothetical protein [Syntrophaceae bacterium]
MANLNIAENRMPQDGRIQVKIGGKEIDIPWLNDFGFGSKDESKNSRPPYSEVLEKMDLVHEQALNLLKSQTNEQLGEPNLVNATFGQSNEKRI